MISQQVRVLPQAKLDKIYAMLKSEGFILFRQAVAAEAAIRKLQAIEMGLRVDAPQGQIHPNGHKDMVYAQRMKAFEEVLDEFSKQDYKFREVELTVT